MKERIKWMAKIIEEYKNSTSEKIATKVCQHEHVKHLKELDEKKINENLAKLKETESKTFKRNNGEFHDRETL